MHRRLYLLLSCAVVIKLVYLIQYARLPFLRAPIFDSIVYLRQARAVLDHRFDDAALLAFSPLYGYFLALLGAGDPIGAPILAQLALGTLNLALVYRLVRPAAGEPAALLSAALYLGYGLLLSYESKIVSEPLALTLALLATAAYQSAACRAARPLATAAAGALLSLTVLQRASLIFLPPIAILLAALPWSPAERLAPLPRLRRAAGIALGVALILGGHGLWNRAHSGLFVPVILVSQTVQKTTAADFGDDFGAFAQNPRGVATALDVVSQAESRLAARRAGRPDPGAASATLGLHLLGLLKNAPLKLLHTFTDYEVSYDYGYFGERSEVPALAVLPVSFGTLLILGVCGALALARRASAWALLPHLPFALASIATTVVFHSSSRYRLFLVIPLILLGGPGLVALTRLSGWRQRLLGQLPVLLLCAGFGWRALTYQMIAPAQWELRVAQSAAVLGDQAELSRRIARARALSPNDPAVEARVRLLTHGLPPAAP